MSHAKVYAGFGGQFHDPRLVQLSERRVNAKVRLPFNAGFGCQVGHAFKRGDELRAAIRITRIVDRVRADEEVLRPEHLGPA